MTASILGFRFTDDVEQYATAKSAIVGLTRTLAHEGKKYNILANAVVPSVGAAVGLGRCVSIRLFI